MDRNATLGFVLIFMLLMLWMYMNSPKPAPVGEQAKQAVVKKDSVQVAQPKLPEAKEKKSQNDFGKFFADRTKGVDRVVTIETDLYTAEIGSK
ncbi:MAG TPA: hypothetical protein VI758_08880, partial [Bacteroidota bacterium]